MIECTTCSRLTPGFNGKCSQCLDSAKKNMYQEHQQTLCFIVDFLRQRENEIEMAFVRWQVERDKQTGKLYDVPGEDTVNPEEAFTGPGFLNREMYEGWLHPAPRRTNIEPIQDDWEGSLQGESTEEQISRYVRADGTPK